mmetsp:Transcript_20553/g.34582  ORF Transcript_20553/g.34582 Transcript_20553/m.34582 type:complete len:397 (+) Transcript_20553:13-1203(+)
MKTVDFVSIALLPSVALVAADEYSKGCGQKLTIGSPGETVVWTTTYQGVEYDQKLTLPDSYTPDTPVPLQMHHHGWGSSSSECGASCSRRAPKHGFASIALQGIGKPGWASWNGSGTVASPGSRGAVCQTNAIDYCSEYPECGDTCKDNCYWTTCEDSVQYVSEILDTLQDNLCLDLDRVWATGCSNGGIFLYELAKDPRMSGRLAGIVPLVGVPHNGFNFGPTNAMHYMGMFGTDDTTVPALLPTNTNQVDVNVDTANRPGGWYFQTARSTTDLWGDCMGCGERVNATEWGISSQAKLECTQRSTPEKGNGGDSGVVDVVECSFKGGHVCGLNAQWATAFNFMSSHVRVGGGALTCSPAEVPSPSVCGARGTECSKGTECCSNRCSGNGNIWTCA